MKVLAIIPARGGSKGIPGKNIKPLAGKPLIAYTIEAARAVFKDEDICISTDAEEIAAVVRQCGLQVPFLRPDSLAGDASTTYDVLLHAVAYYRELGQAFDTLVLLQPTSPFRTARHIREALEQYKDDMEMVVSVTETSANPYYVLFEENAEGYLKKSKPGDFTSRQACPQVWQYNGAVYVINIKALLQKSHLKFDKVVKYVMDDRSSIDLDTPLDWDFAEFLLMRHS